MSAAVLAVDTGGAGEMETAGSSFIGEAFATS